MPANNFECQVPPFFNRLAAVASMERMQRYEVYIAELGAGENNHSPAVAMIQNQITFVKTA